MNEPDVFDSKLLQRLTRPLVKPGVINHQMARGIILRSQLFTNRLPLLSIAQRHYNVAESQPEQLPIVYAQSRLPETDISNGISIQSDRQSSQSNASQTTVMQAKFISPTPSTSLTVKPNSQPSIPQSQNQTDSLPLVSSFSPNSDPSQASLPSESAPIVYGKSLSPEMITTSNISLQPNANEQNAQSNASQTRVIQAKFASPTSPISSINTNPQPIIAQEQITSNSLPLVSSFSPNYERSQASLAAESVPIVYGKSLSPETITTSNISLQPNVNRQNPQSNPSQTRVVQAKFASPTSPTSSINPNSQPIITQEQTPSNSLPLVTSFLPNYERNQTSLEVELAPIVYDKSLQLSTNFLQNRDNFESRQIPIIYAKFQKNDGINKLNNPVYPAKFISGVEETIPPSLPKLIVQQTMTNSAKINTPLVFSYPSITTQQASPEVQNRGIERFSSTPTYLGIAPVTPQPSASANLPPQITHSQEALPQIDIDTLAAKVERKFMRKLVVENERRGGKL